MGSRFMENRDIYNSVVSKVATLLPMFATQIVDMALKAEGVNKDNFTPVQLLDAIENFIDPRLCQHLGEECSVLTAGTGTIIMNDTNSVVKIDPVISNMLGEQLDTGKSKAEQFEQLNKLGILTSYTDCKHLDNFEKFIPKINRCLNIIYIKPDNGGTHQVIAVIQDVSVRKHLEHGIRHYSKQLEHAKHELNLAYEKAMEASEAKSEFLSHMSHELRTPLNGILGFAQILEMDGEESLTDDQLRNVKEIINAGNHLLDLINEILDLAKIERGKLDLSLEEINLHEVIASCLSLIEPLARKRQIEIINKFNGNTYIVYADRKRLKQVLLNLLSNAVKYNRDKGSITLSSRLVDEQRIRININDTGPGMSREQLEKIFVPFERLDNRNYVDGVGIGLAITKRLIELMDGSVGVDSKIGEGSNFWLELRSL